MHFRSFPFDRVYSVLRMKRSGTGYNVVKRLPHRKTDKFNKFHNDKRQRAPGL